eukprot:Lankesteria_metandrocarpae@DN4347_c0_g1_i1.p1
MSIRNSCRLLECSNIFVVDNVAKQTLLSNFSIRIGSKSKHNELVFVLTESESVTQAVSFSLKCNALVRKCDNRSSTNFSGTAVPDINNPPTELNCNVQTTATDIVRNHCSCKSNDLQSSGNGQQPWVCTDNGEHADSRNIGTSPSVVIVDDYSSKALPAELPVANALKLRANLLAKRFGWNGTQVRDTVRRVMEWTSLDTSRYRHTSVGGEFKIGLSIADHIRLLIANALLEQPEVLVVSAAPPLSHTRSKPVPNLTATHYVSLNLHADRGHMCVPILSAIARQADVPIVIVSHLPLHSMAASSIDRTIAVCAHGGTLFECQCAAQQAASRKLTVTRSIGTFDTGNPTVALREDVNLFESCNELLYKEVCGPVATGMDAEHFDDNSKFIRLPRCPNLSCDGNGGGAYASSSLPCAPRSPFFSGIWDTMFIAKRCFLSSLHSRWKLKLFIPVQILLGLLLGGSFYKATVIISEPPSILQLASQLIANATTTDAATTTTSASIDTNGYRSGSFATGGSSSSDAATTELEWFRVFLQGIDDDYYSPIGTILTDGVDGHGSRPIQSLLKYVVDRYTDSRTPGNLHNFMRCVHEAYQLDTQGYPPVDWPTPVGDSTTGDLHRRLGPVSDLHFGDAIYCEYSSVERSNRVADVTTTTTTTTTTT